MPSPIRRQFEPLLPLAALLASLIAAGCGSSAGDATAPAVGDTAARAQELTGLMLEKYRESSSYTDHATYVEQAVYRGEGIEHELPFYQMSLAYQRPNKLRLTLEEALPSAEGVRDGCDIACDGEKLRARALALPDQLLEAAAPEKLDAENLLPDPVLRGEFQGRGLGEVFPQLAMLLSRDDDELVFPDDADPRLLADAEVNGHSCYRVATTNPEGTRVLWIDRENFTLVRMELPAEAHRRRYADGEMFLKLAVWIDFEEPTFGARIDDASFELKTPEDARIVAQFEIPAAKAETEEKSTGEEARETRESAPKEEGEVGGKEVAETKATDAEPADKESKETHPVDAKASDTDPANSEPAKAEPASGDESPAEEASSKEAASDDQPANEQPTTDKPSETGDE